MMTLNKVIGQGKPILWNYIFSCNIHVYSKLETVYYLMGWRLCVLFFTDHLPPDNPSTPTNIQ